VTTNIQNNIMTNIKQTTTNDVSSNISQTQSIPIANVGGNVIIANVTMTQSAQIVATALMKTSAYSSVINDAATKLTQSSTAVSSNPISDIIKSVTGFLATTLGICLAIGGVVLIIVLVVIFKVF
jgi:hypothetical protein